MDRGRFAAEDTPLSLIARFSTREVVELRFGPGAYDDVALRLDGLVERMEVLPDRLLLYTDDGDTTLDEVHAKGVHPDASLVRRSTLEDVFLRLTGRTLVE